MKDFSKDWKSSKKPNKQRKYRLNAPLHIKQKLTHSHFSKELRKKFGKRNIGLRKGDKVKIMRGQFKKHEGKIERIDTKRERLYINGVEMVKKDGTKTNYPIRPSNVIIIELNLDDKMRQKALEKGSVRKG